MLSRVSSFSGSAAIQRGFAFPSRVRSCARSLLATSPFALRSCPHWMTAFSSQECFFLKAFDALQGVLVDRLRRTGLDRGKLRLRGMLDLTGDRALLRVLCILQWSLFLGYRSLSFSLFLAYSPPLCRSSSLPMSLSLVWWIQDSARLAEQALSTGTWGPIVGIARFALEPNGQSDRWACGGAFVWREIQTRSTWQSRCVWRGSVGVGVMRHAFTWYRFCVLRPPVPKCPPAQS